MKEPNEKNPLAATITIVVAGMCFYLFAFYFHSAFISHLEIDLLEDRVYVLEMIGIKKYETPGGYDFGTGKPESAFNPRNGYLVSQGKNIVLARFLSKSGTEQFAEKLRDEKRK